MLCLRVTSRRPLWRRQTEDRRNFKLRHYLQTQTVTTELSVNRITRSCGTARCGASCAGSPARRCISARRIPPCAATKVGPPSVASHVCDARSKHGVALAVCRGIAPFVRLARRRLLGEALADLDQCQPLPVAVVHLHQHGVGSEGPVAAVPPQRERAASSRSPGRAAMRRAAIPQSTGCRQSSARSAPPGGGHGH